MQKFSAINSLIWTIASEEYSHAANATMQCFVFFCALVWTDKLNAKIGPNLYAKINILIWMNLRLTNFHTPSMVFFLHWFKQTSWMQKSEFSCKYLCAKHYAVIIIILIRMNPCCVCSDQCKHSHADNASDFLSSLFETFVWCKNSVKFKIFLFELMSVNASVSNNTNICTHQCDRLQIDKSNV